MSVCTHPAEANASVLDSGFAKIYSDLDSSRLPNNGESSDNRIRASPLTSYVSRQASTSSTISASSSRRSDSESLEPAVPNNIGTATSSRQSDASSSTKSIGTDAFVRSNRNSVISLASRKRNSPPNLDESSSNLVTPQPIPGTSRADRSLEEGEILEETPPAAMAQIYPYRDSKLEPRSTRAPSTSSDDHLRQSHGREIRDHEHYANRASSSGDMLSPPILRRISSRSSTPSPSTTQHSTGDYLQSLSHNPGDVSARYGHQRTPYRSTRPESRPSTADSRSSSRTSGCERRSTIHQAEDTSRTPRRTPAHRRYESNLIPSLEQSRAPHEDYADQQSQRSGRSYSSLARYTEVDRRSQTSTPASLHDRRSRTQLSSREINTLPEVDVARRHDAYASAHAPRHRQFDDHGISGSTRSTRSYTSDRRSVHSTAPYRSSAPTDYDKNDIVAHERPSSRLSEGRERSYLRQRAPSVAGVGDATLSSASSSRALNSKVSSQARIGSPRYSTSSTSRRNVSQGQADTPDNHADGKSPCLSANSLDLTSAPVFVDSPRRSRSSQHNARTLPVSHSRSRIALRDLEVASPDWWQEVSEIREKAAQATSDRPMSRASTRKSLSSLTSPESVRSEYGDRRGIVRSTMPSTSSRTSLDDVADALGRPASATARYRDASSKSERPYTPVMDHSIPPIIRETPSRQGRAFQTPGKELDSSEPHHDLLRDVRYSALQLLCSED